MDGKGGGAGSDVEVTHHGIDIIDFTVDQCVGIVVFGKLSCGLRSRKSLQLLISKAEAAMKVEKRYLFSFIPLLF